MGYDNMRARYCYKTYNAQKLNKLKNQNLFKAVWSDQYSNAFKRCFCFLNV